MCFDDNSVLPVEDVNKIVSKEAYCLFYQQRGIAKEEILTGDPVEIDEVEEKKAVGQLPPDKSRYGSSKQENCSVM